MTWVVHERVGSRKWKLTDDGSARGTIILVCATDDPARDVSAAKDTAPGTTPAASSSQGLWVSIKDAGYALGANAPAGVMFDGVGAINQNWKVDGFSGAQPDTGAQSVWFVEVSLAWVGDITEIYGAVTTAGIRRRDVDVMIGATSRDAAAFGDWWTATIPSLGDVDWVTPGASLQVVSDARVDVNGAPIIQKLPGARMTVTVLDDMRGSNGIENAVANAKQYLGQRNDATAMAWGVGKVVLESVEYVQIAHGFGRATYRFHADEFYHLQQEACLNGWDNSQTSHSSSTITMELTVVHVRAVWRQPFPLTTAADAWELSDLFGADVATYIGEVYT